MDLVRLAQRVADTDLTLEHVLTSTDWFGLTTATTMQRAICRVADGLPIDDLWDIPLIDNPKEYPAEVAARSSLKWAIGTRDVPTTPPREMYVEAGIRGGKSLMAAAVAVKASQVCDLRHLRPGETPRFGIISLTRDNARVIFQHLLGACVNSSRVSSLVADEPTNDTVFLRHPSGRTVEIRVVAGSRAGGSLVSRWLIGAAFDEAPRMVGQEEGVVNLDDARKAALERLVPGGQLWFVGSPWAPLGPVYNATVEFHGKPSGLRAVIRATGPAMNPFHWTPERTHRVAMPPPDGDPEVYLTDCLAEFADLEKSLFTEPELRAVTRDGVTRIDPEYGVHYVAYMDPATRGNAWTLVVGAKLRTGKPTIVHARQWKPGAKPLRAREVLEQVLAEVAPYGIADVWTDQYGGDFLVDIGNEVGLTVMVEAMNRQLKGEYWRTVKMRVGDRSVDLIDVPYLIEDLKRIRKRLTAEGHTIVFPHTQDGRHCDYAPPVAGVIAKCILEPEEDEEPETVIERAQRAARDLVNRGHYDLDDDDSLYFDDDEMEEDTLFEEQWA